MPFILGSPFQFGQPILETILIPMRDVTHRERVAARVSTPAPAPKCDGCGKPMKQAMKSAFYRCIRFGIDPRCRTKVEADTGLRLPWIPPAKERHAGCFCPTSYWMNDKHYDQCHYDRMRKIPVVVTPVHPLDNMQPGPRRAKGWDRRFTL